MDTIGKYTLIRVIGEGGMGRVYEAMDPIIGRRVAIKTISLNVVADAEMHSRFFREAQAAGRLSHPNLITIHDIGEADGVPFIVMEYLEGMDLSRAIRYERLSYDTKMQIMVDVCEGLAFAHGHDIIHRDIKPANIFMTSRGRVKILDFGLARGAVSDVTRTGKLLGTPNYMSPEQIRGDNVDHRADIFSTGVVFYELLSGRKAFEGDSIATTIYKVLETQPQPVHLIDGQLPAALSAVIDRALAKDRLARYQTSNELLDAIHQAHGRTTQLERSHLQTIPLPSSGTATPVRTSRATITGWIVAGVAVAGFLGFAVWSRSSHDRRPPTAITQADPGSRSIAPVENPVPAVSSSPSPPGPPPAAIAKSGADTSNAPKALTKERALPEAPGRTGPSSAVVPAPPRTPDTTIAITSPPPTAVAVPPPPEPKAAPIEPPPSVASPPSVAPAPAPTPPPPAARTEETTGAAAQAVLARYRTALESRDISSLKRIWPALSGRQEDALRNEFEHARAIAVGFDGVDVRPTNSGATVTCRRNYTVTTAEGQTLKTTTTMIMTLVRRDGAWSIETIRHEAAR
jgi:serine/threonine protein kinase